MTKRKGRGSAARRRASRSSSSSSGPSSTYVRRSGSLFPMPIRDDYLQTRKIFRFAGQITSSAVINITCNNLCSLLMLATAAASECSLFTSFQLHRISMWCGSPGPTSNSEITINYITSSASLVGGIGREMATSDISTGTDRPAHVSATVPRGSIFRNWIAPNVSLGNPVIAQLGVNLNGTVNTAMLTIDVDISHTVLQNTTQLAQLIRAVAGATVNTVYAASLDGGGVYNQIGDIVTLTGL